MNAALQDAAPDASAIAARVGRLDWTAIGAALDTDGVAIATRLLTHDETRGLAATYDARERFRSRVVMQRHRFGRGEYQYFSYPLPPIVQALRERLYERLAPVANRWAARLGSAASGADAYPPVLDAFLSRCHDAGQRHPTPLLLRYATDDYNCLHQDLYGEHVFPLQVVILLSEPGRDFDGGELVLVEQRPRGQSAVHVVPLRQGDAAIIATHHRPGRAARGWHRVNLRHGVSRITRGRRCTAGIIFHDAAGPAGDA